MGEYIKRETLQEAFKSVAEDCTCPLHIAAEIDQILEQADAADVVEVVPELRKAVVLLRERFEKAKQNPIVRDPLAYALYQTWRTVDGAGKGRWRYE